MGGVPGMMMASKPNEIEMLELEERFFEDWSWRDRPWFPANYEAEAFN